MVDPQGARGSLNMVESGWLDVGWLGRRGAGIQRLNGQQRLKARSWKKFSIACDPRGWMQDPDTLSLPYPRCHAMVFVHGREVEVHPTMRNIPELNFLLSESQLPRRQSCQACQAFPKAEVRQLHARAIQLPRLVAFLRTIS